VRGTGWGIMETLVAAGRLSANQFLIRGALPCSAILAVRFLLALGGNSAIASAVS